MSLSTGLVLACVTGALFVSSAPASAQTDDPAPLQSALTAALDADTLRVPLHVGIDRSGDATVLFAISNAIDDPEATRTAALADTLNLLRTAYQSPQAGGITSLTVLGTFPFKSTKGRNVREFPVLRAVLSAERAAHLGWDELSPAGLPAAVDVWWLQEAFAMVGSPPAEPAAPDPPLVAGGAVGPLDDIRPRLTIAVAHLDEVLAGLDAGQIQIARSQFKQFFDSWDDVDRTIAELDAARYDALDVQLERAEVALLHTQPENVEQAAVALRTMRASLAEILGGAPD